MDTFITLSHSLRMFSASPIFRYQATEGRVIRVSISYFDLYLIFCWEKSLPLILGILIWAYATVNQIIGTELSPWLGQSINNIVLRAGRNLTHRQYHQWQSLHFKREKTEVKWLVLCLLSKFVDALVWSERAVAGGKRKEGQRDARAPWGSTGQGNDWRRGNIISPGNKDVRWPAAEDLHKSIASSVRGCLLRLCCLPLTVKI